MDSISEKNARMKIISSLDKIRNKDDLKEYEISSLTALKGENVNFQIYFEMPDKQTMKPVLESDLSEYITLYEVRCVNMDYIWQTDDDVITDKPGIMPDLLIPISDIDGYFSATRFGNAMWVNVRLPDDIEAGEYDIKISYWDNSVTLKLNVIDARLPKQKVKFTQWFHVDCIADYYNLPMYSEKHWEMIDNFMVMARRLGINMILTPILSYDLDTWGENSFRPVCQLVDINLDNGVYSFGFSRLDRFVDMALKNGMEYFEISHLFHPRGAEWCNQVDGEKKIVFNMTMKGDIPEYVEFLKNFVPSVVGYLKKKGIFEKCYFHISDEPVEEIIHYYEYANSYIRPLLEGGKTIDAISNSSYYLRGLVDAPVQDIDRACFKEFEGVELSEKWCYYCCGNYLDCTNRFLNMPLYRDRIIGLQMYKYGFNGCLHWGFNFYYCGCSYYKYNPFVSTSGNFCYPSGDPFSVYPGDNGALPSIRALVFKDALEDIQICQKLEEYLGKEAVIKLIDDEAGMDLTFFDYPRNAEFIPNLVNKMRKIIADHEAK